MKLEKFIQEVAKQMMRHNLDREKTPTFWKHKDLDDSINSDKIAITTNGYFAIIIPESWNIFHCEYGKTDPIKCCNWKNFDKLELTGLSKKIKKETYFQMKTKDRETWVNEKYVKYFDKSEFYQETNLSIVYVSEYGKLVGVIMPYKMKEQD